MPALEAFTQFNQFNRGIKRFQFPIVALWLLFFVIISIMTVSAQDTSKTGIVAGLKANDNYNYIHLGLIKVMSTRTSIYFSAESGGDGYEFKPTGIYTIPIAERITIGFLVGGNIQIYKEDSEDDEVLTYLSLATGIGLNFTLSKQLSLYTTYDYTKNDALENNSRYGIGAIFWIP